MIDGQVLSTHSRHRRCIDEVEASDQQQRSAFIDPEQSRRAARGARVVAAARLHRPRRQLLDDGENEPQAASHDPNPRHPCTGATIEVLEGESYLVLAIMAHLVEFVGYGSGGMVGYFR